ncbi:hypothetical protein MC885_006348 [Smutsia gigantea]|nr:hypothetical protein MC885_006348 [Smutsia gigantea]
MTAVPVAFGQAECNGDSSPENGQRPISKPNEEASDVGGTPPYYRVEPSLQDFPTEGNQEKSEKLQGNMVLNWSTEEKILKEKPEENLFIVHKAITDLCLQETSVDEITFREGHHGEKIPLSSSNQEISKQKESGAGQPLGERDEDRKSKAHQATEIEWLGFRKPSHVDVLHSKHHEEQDMGDEEIDDDGDEDDCNDDEDEVREIEFKKKNEEGFQLREDDASEDSPLSSPSSQPVTPDEQPAFGKKNDISRNAYSRYNTISYRKIRKGNTKQRIDEFESMMHL